MYLSENLHRLSGVRTRDACMTGEAVRRSPNAPRLPFLFHTLDPNINFFRRVANYYIHTHIEVLRYLYPTGGPTI